MEELTHSLLENGSIQVKEQQYVLTQTPSELQIPDTIQGIIAARIDRLEENLKRIMQVASVIGREFAFKILQAISGMREDLKSQLMNLQGLEFIYEKSLFPELEYIFKHALTQEVAYNSLLLRRRKEIHERIGKAMEELYPERLEEFYEMLAYHYGRADESGKAYRYLKLSAEKAYARHANWEAFRFYGDAISLLSQLPRTEASTREAVEIRFLMARPARLLGYPENTLEILAEGADLAHELGDSRMAADLEGFLANAYTIRGEYSLALQHATKCFDEAERIHDLARMAPLAREMCATYTSKGAFVESASLATKVISLIEREEKRSETYGRPGGAYTMLCCYAGMAETQLGRFNEAMTFCDKALRNARANEDSLGEAYSEFSFGMALNRRGDGSAAIRHLEHAVALFEKLNSTVFLGMALTMLSTSYSLTDDLRKARQVVEKALTIDSETGYSMGQTMGHLILSNVLMDLKDRRGALAHGEEGLRLARAHGERFLEGIALVAVGRAAALSNPEEIQRSKEKITEGIQILTELKVKPWCAQAHFILAEVCAMGAERNEALRNLNIAETLNREMGADYWLARVAHARGRLEE
jgi:tetratricopeptide (TPR) repeat protein